MGLFNALGVFMAALSLVLLAKHGFDMGTFAAPLDLALTYYEDVTNTLIGWIAPLAKRALALAGWSVEVHPHWKHITLLTLLYCGAWTRIGGGGAKGSVIFDAVWGTLLALAAGLAAGLVPIAPGGAGTANAVVIAAFPVAAVLLFSLGDSMWTRFALRTLMKMKTEVPWWQEVLSFSQTEMLFAAVGFAVVALALMLSETPLMRALPSPGLMLLLAFAVAAALAFIAKSAREAKWSGQHAADNNPALNPAAEARAIFRRDPLRHFGMNILGALAGALAFVLTNAGLKLAGL